MDEIKVGDKATVRSYTDREVFEVIEVFDQKHVVVRHMESRRTDNNGMSDCQEYEYISDPREATMELKFRRGKWCEVVKINIAEEFTDGVQNMMMAFHRRNRMTDKQMEKYSKGETIEITVDHPKIYFGIADAYYDYSF